jgi:hypothetical protein
MPPFTVGIQVDYDDINARMTSDNRGFAELTIKQLESWDTSCNS